MPEQITVTMSLQQAEAVVDAIACMNLAAMAEISTLCEAFVPEGLQGSTDTDAFKREHVTRAVEVAEVLREEIKGVYHRDPDMQEILHQLKTYARRYDQD